MTPQVSVSIYVEATPEAAMATAEPARVWDCPPATVPLPGDLVRVDDAQAPCVVIERVWVGPYAVALLVAPPRKSTVNVPGWVMGKEGS